MKSPVLFGCSALLAAITPAAALDLDYRLKANATVLADRIPEPPGEAREDQQLYFDFTPWLHLQFSPDWAAFLRARAFVPTGEVLLPANDSNRAEEEAEAFVGLKEAWIEYGGLTSYPGEVLRFGRQRLRQADAQWWDADIDSLRWIFDTTLLQADLAVARQFHSYRSDDPLLPDEQRDRTYLLGSIGTEWRPNHRLALRVAQAIDDNELPATGSSPDAETELQRDRATWVGLSADNRAYDGPESPPLAYWATATWLNGEEQRATTDATGTVTAVGEQDLSGWSAETGLRYRLPGEWPLQFGAAYVYSSGGRDGDESEQYRQTGLQTNSSRYTGTRAQVSRYTDAYRAELGNLEAGTAFASLSRGASDASLVYNRFRRPDGTAPVRADAFPLAPVNARTDLGQGYDLVVSRYFSLGSVLPRFASESEAESALRLRASLFDPGGAYGADVENAYRIALELTLWY
jgi:alginate production protein